jgi:hypothetical protein
MTPATCAAESSALSEDEPDIYTAVGLERTHQP